MSRVWNWNDRRIWFEGGNPASAASFIFLKRGLLDQVGILTADAQYDRIRMSLPLERTADMTPS